MTYLYIDIETIPTQSVEAVLRIANGIKPPGTMKKAETIAAWEKEQKPVAIEEAIDKTALNGAYGQICCIGMAIDDGEVSSISWPLNVDSEARMLSGFFELIGGALNMRFPVIVGHNVASFDIRFMWQRAMVHGVRVPAWLPKDAKPWDAGVFDTMTAWAGARETISMDNLCFALGIEGKSGIDGSMIGKMFDEGKHQEIAEYCRADVERTRKIHKKMKIAFGEAA